MLRRDLEPAGREKWTNHGIGISPEGRYVYLPGMAPMAGRRRALVEDCSWLGQGQMTAEQGTKLALEGLDRAG